MIKFITLSKAKKQSDFIVSDKLDLEFKAKMVEFFNEQIPVLISKRIKNSTIKFKVEPDSLSYKIEHSDDLLFEIHHYSNSKDYSTDLIKWFHSNIPEDYKSTDLKQPGYVSANYGPRPEQDFWFDFSVE